MRSLLPWKYFVLLVFVSAVLTSSVVAAEPTDRILVFTKNEIGKGLYVHDNIPASVAAIQKLGKENGFAVEVSTNAASFTPENLKRFKAIVFDNTNNEIFENEDQKSALQAYIHAGGGFVGIHSASGSMRKWPWFWALLGGKFSRHPKLQPFTIHVKDPNDISTAHLPASFQWTDEFYFLDNMAASLHVLLAGDLKTLEDPKKDESKYPGGEVPLAWRHEFEGGRAWYTALGHKSEYYSDPKLTKHILGGILWSMGKNAANKNL
jgi:uncharacterized protein